MKNGYSFIFENKEDFYKFDLFDHDLILFREESSGYISKYEDMVILGGRSAKPFKGGRLADEIKLLADDKRFFMDFIYDNGRKFALTYANGKMILVFNRLFRSCGIGVAAVFDVSPEFAAEAVKSGIFDRLGAFLYSPGLIELSKSRKDARLSSEYDGLVYSVFKIADSLLAAMGEGLSAMDSREREAVYFAIRSAAAITGCNCEKIERPDTVADIKLDKDSLAALLLCLFSLCRWLSSGRRGSVSVNARESGYYSIRLEFEMTRAKLRDMDLRCISFCESMAERLELPLSIEIDNSTCVAEFIPLRVDPSLSGLKAGVRISFKD